MCPWAALEHPKGHHTLWDVKIRCLKQPQLEMPRGGVGLMPLTSGCQALQNRRKDEGKGALVMIDVNKRICIISVWLILQSCAASANIWTASLGLRPRSPRREPQPCNWMNGPLGGGGHYHFGFDVAASILGSRDLRELFFWVLLAFAIADQYWALGSNSSC